MNANLTEIICIVDRSGSMSAIKTDAIGGFNTFLAEQKKVPGDATLTLVLFNHDYLLQHDGLPLAQVPDLNEQTYVPGGTTALLDAIGRTLDDVGKRLSQTPEEKRPGKVLMAILTDGLENASKDYTRDRIFQMIQHQRDAYKWEFAFLAANQDAIQGALSLGISASMAVNFDPTGAGVRDASTTMSNLTASYRMGNNPDRDQSWRKPRPRR